MELGDREESGLLAADGRMVSSSSPFSIIPSSFSSIRQCRICHEEEEEESSTSMESACACSGTLKFAHRECIQSWCNEKGNTVCEICLQTFKPDYTVPPKKALVEVPVTIRESLEVPRINYDPQNPALINIDDGDDLDYAECSSSASQRRASWCRSMALVFTIILLIRQLMAVLAVGADHYAFTLITVLVLRASGILLPCYLALRMISAIQRGQQQHQLEQLQLHRRNDSPLHGVEDESQQHVIQIHS